MSAEIRIGSFKFHGSAQKGLHISNLPRTGLIAAIAALVGVILGAATLVSLPFGSVTLSATLFTGSIASFIFAVVQICGCCLRGAEKLPPEFRERIYYNGKPLFPRQL